MEYTELEEVEISLQAKIKELSKEVETLKSKLEKNTCYPIWQVMYPYYYPYPCPYPYPYAYHYPKTHIYVNKDSA